MRWSAFAAPGAALLGASLLPSVAGLYDDEVGQYEWALQQVGKPIAFAFSTEASDRIFVASASGTLASVLLKDGTIQWRRLANTAGGMRLLRAASRGLVSVTDSGLVQSWKGSSGDLVWQREYADPVVELLLVGPAAKQSAIVVRKGEIEARTLAGKAEWTLSVSSAGFSGDAWAAANDPDAADSFCVVVAEADGGKPQALQISAATEKVTKSTELPKSIGVGLRRGSFINVDTHIITLVKGQVTAVPVCGGETTSFDLPSNDFKLSKWQKTAGVFAVTDGAQTLVLGIGDKGLKKLRTFEGITVVGPLFSAHEDETGQPVAVAVTKADGVQLQLMDPASGNVQPAMFAKGYSATDHGPAELLLMHELKSGEHRTVISAADHSFAGIQGEKVMWVREEALASIHQAVFYSRQTAVTLAERVHHATSAGGAAEAQGLSALLVQLTSLPARLAELAQEPAELVAAFASWVTPKRLRRKTDVHLAPGARMPTSSDELRDFGANKLVIAITSSFKLFALEATTSEIVWHQYLGSPDGCTDMAQCGPTMRLLPSDASPVNELFLMLPSSKGHQALWIDPLAGKIQRQEKLPAGTPRLTSLLPLMHHHSAEDFGTDSQPFLLIDEAHKVHLLPSGSATPEKLLSESDDRLFHYEIDKAAQTVQGFSVQKAGLTELWNIDLAGERILASTVPEHREWAHVPVYIKGDSTILYKYINSNMIAVATEHTSGVGNSPSLNLYVLDAVSGQILHQSHVPGGSQPVHLVACDNWVVMHYQNQVRTRFEIAVVELFQAKPDDGPWDIIFGGGKSNQTQSAHRLETPVPLQQTYVMHGGVTAMGVTATNKGITPRSIIMALTTEHIFRVSKDMVNPRRPYPPSSSAAAPVGGSKSSVPGQFAPTKEEMVPPYAPVLPLKAHDVLTNFHPQSQVKGIISSPSGLESTSLVFSYGLDLFFTPVQSAKAYDVLSPGFNYVMLYLSVSVVVALWVVTSWLASRKALQDRWK